MKKKGFTLVELLAVIVILAIIALIAVPMVLDVIEKARKEAFKDSVFSAFTQVEYYLIEHNLGEVPKSGIQVNYLNLKNNSFQSGRFVENADGILVAEFISDGKYCASGTLTNLNVNKGECEITSPTVEVVVNEKEATITLNDTYGIVGYAITTTSEDPTEWIMVEEVASMAETITAEASGTYYVHVKNKYGKTSKLEYQISQSAFCEYEVGTVWTFDYKGSEEEFIIPCSGTYTLEVYGAQGGNSKSDGCLGPGGKGGHSLGNVSLIQSDRLFINVGGAASTTSGGYNGGGNGVAGQIYSYHYGGGGGGATHIATSTGLLSALSQDRESILIVAGGGGGGSLGTYNSTFCGAGGTGGGTSGGSGGSASTTGVSYGGFAGGDQSTGYAFGQGGHGSAGGYLNTSGGGGGYYGGKAGMGTAGGGSGYIGGVTDGVTENGVQAGNGRAQITLVSLSS